MFHDARFLTTSGLHTFLQLHMEALQNAGHLLGSRYGLRTAQCVLDDFSGNPVITRRMTRNLRKLHDLLSLKHVGDPDRVESACFAVLDPASPQVEEICLLADGLHDAALTAGIELDVDECDIMMVARREVYP